MVLDWASRLDNTAIHQRYSPNILGHSAVLRRALHLICDSLNYRAERYQSIGYRRMESRGRPFPLLSGRWSLSIGLAGDRSCWAIAGAVGLLCRAP
jgi:hypothetical protein